MIDNNLQRFEHVFSVCIHADNLINITVCNQQLHFDNMFKNCLIQKNSKLCAGTAAQPHHTAFLKIKKRHLN